MMEYHSMSGQKKLMVKVLLCVSMILMVTSDTPESLRIVGGRIEGLVVSIHPKTDTVTGKDVVHRVKELFSQASQILHRATKGHSQFGHITILVSEAWASRAGLIADGGVLHWAMDEAHFQLKPFNPLHGDEMYTQQPRQCGNPGAYVHLTEGFVLDKSKADSAMMIVQNWMRFRYGVFPEKGMKNYAQYPVRYTTADGVPQPTTCTNTLLKGDWKGHCESSPDYNQLDWDCEFEPDLEQDFYLDSSLMTWPLFPQMTSFCDEETHNPYSPTIHNALCGARSIWEIINQHEDFLEWHPSNTIEYINPDYSLVQQKTGTRFMFLVENSSKMNETGRLWLVHTALEKLIELYLPDRTEVGVVTYTDEPQIRARPTWLSEYRARDILRRLTTEKPVKSMIASPANALNYVINEFFQLEGGTCILVSSGIADPTLTEKDTIDLQDLLLLRSTRLISINTGSTKDQSSFVKTMVQLSQVSGGFALVLHEMLEDETALAELDSAMMAIAGTINNKVIQITREARKTGHNSGNFLVSEDATDVVEFHVTFLNSHRREPVYLTSPSGMKLNGTYEGYDDKRISQEVSITTSNAEQGNWRFHVDTEKPIVVSTYAITSDDEVIRIRGWIHVQPTNRASWPILIYVEILKGSRPITNARVDAFIRGANEQQQMQLLDTGKGNPDTFENDGIYSRYVPESLKKGYYTVNVQVTDEKEARILERSGAITLESITGPFQRVLFLGTFYVGHSEDIAPPSRVADLRLLSTTEAKIVLTWTEPGDNYDTGTVAKYRFWWSSKQNCVLSANAACAEELDPMEPLEPQGAGFKATATLPLPPIYSRIVYYTLTSYDESGNAGPPSNSVPVVWNIAQSDLSAIQESQRKGVWIQRGGELNDVTSNCDKGCPVISTSLGVAVVVALSVALIAMAAVALVCFLEHRKRKQTEHSCRTMVVVRRQDAPPEREDSRDRMQIRDIPMISVSPQSTPEQSKNDDSDRVNSCYASPLPEFAPPELPSKEEKSCPLLDRTNDCVPVGQSGRRATIYHRPDCAFSHSDVTQCACNCPYSSVLV